MSEIRRQEKALLQASKEGKFNIVELLINTGTNINIQDEDGWTPLMLASQYSHTKIVDFLLQNKADVNIQNNHGDVALMMSVGSLDITEALIQHNADINIQDSEGYSALMDACQIDSIETVQLLLNAGADITLKNNYGFTIIDFAKERAECSKYNVLADPIILSKSQQKTKEIIQILEEYILNNKTAKLDTEQTVFSL